MSHSDDHYDGLLVYAKALETDNNHKILKETELLVSSVELNVKSIVKPAAWTLILKSPETNTSNFIDIIKGNSWQVCRCKF